MALPDIKKVPPAPIFEFRGTEESDPIQIPELPKNRKCTDVGFLVFFVLSVFATVTLAACCGALGTDYNRFLNGYDKCGDTCGTSNRRIKDIDCSGKDLSDKPFMKLKFIGENESGGDVVPDECVDDCGSPNRLWFHRCFPITDLRLKREANAVLTYAEFRHDLKNAINIMISPMVGVGLVLSLGLFLSFYLSATVTVFGVIAAALILLFAFTAYVWYWFLDNTNAKELLYIGLASTIAIFFLGIFICYFYNRYALMVEMFTEATRAVFKMPVMILVPFAAIIFLAVVIASIVFLGALVSTYQSLVKVNDVYQYQDKELAEAAIFYLVVTGIWVIAIANGCQCMIVAGAVSSYYFTRDKTTFHMCKPVATSILVLLRYHFGTVAFGSLCITIFTVARISVDVLEDHIHWKCLLKCMEYSLSCLEEVVEYITKRAYIQTAMHGKSLYKSGMRAARLLWANLLDTISLDIVGDFIMACATVVIILAASLVGITVHRLKYLELTYFWSVITIGAAVTGTIVYFFTQIINVAVETIFLCFCEDKLLNDGKLKPYFMSEELKSLITKAKLEAKKREE